MKKIVFICTANICRSAMAEGIARHLAGNESSLQFSSMGTRALVGEPADALACEVCSEIGVDLSSHRAQQLDSSTLLSADLILCMSKKHRDIVAALSPVLAEKTTLFLTYPKVKLFKKEVRDPFKKSQAFFRTIRTQIEHQLEEMLPVLLEGEHHR